MLPRGCSPSQQHLDPAISQRPDAAEGWSRPIEINMASCRYRDLSMRTQNRFLKGGFKTEVQHSGYWTKGAAGQKNRGEKGEAGHKAG